MVCIYTCSAVFFFLMIRRPPRSTLDRSSAASDVYKRQAPKLAAAKMKLEDLFSKVKTGEAKELALILKSDAVSYTHLRAHETVLDIVCRLLLEKKKHKNTQTQSHIQN